MSFKIVALLTFVAVASALPVEYHHQPAQLLVKKVNVVSQHHNDHNEAEYGPAEYQFNYQVHDDHTGDIKSQEETRHGDQVQGKYTLIDADGYQRIVEYTADKHSGFNAIVRREPIKGYKAPEPQQKYVHSAVPIVKYATPVTKIDSPVAHHYSVPQHQQQQHSNGHETTHVSFSGPSSNYHY